MKKGSIAGAKQSKNFFEQKLTIGLDLGDRSSWYCVLEERGEVVLEQKLGTTQKAMRETFGGMPRSRIALEIGTHSPWISRLLSESKRAEPQGAKQMAAPAEPRTPNMHRAKRNRSSRVRMEAWRLRPLGGRRKRA